MSELWPPSINRQGASTAVLFSSATEAIARNYFPKDPQQFRKMEERVTMFRGTRTVNIELAFVKVETLANIFKVCIYYEHY